MTKSLWESDSIEIQFNPRMPFAEQKQVRNLLAEFPQPSHFWIATSGSTAIKWVALSKKAILTSAKAVNAHLHSYQNDIWLNPLPDFHVGGLGILARSYLSGAKVVSMEGKWDVRTFCATAKECSATLTALVPAQVHDLVAELLTAPKSMRAVIVGGGSLGEQLYHKAVALGWPLLPSYGLTECSSQVATAVIDSFISKTYPTFHLLPHVQTEINSEGFIRIKSPSLLSGYAYITPEGPRFVNPVENGWLLTEDLGELHGNLLKVFGRQSSYVKIGGEGVDLNRLQHIFDDLKLQYGLKVDAALVAIQDERLGHVVHLAADCSADKLKQLLEQFHAVVMPYERIRKIHALTSIPRTPLGKLRRSDLLQQIYSPIHPKES